MKARVHLIIGAVLGVLYSLIARLPMDKLAVMVIFTGLVSFLIDLDHLAVYMLMHFEKGKKEVLNLDISSLLEGMTHDLSGYLYWHTFTIISAFFLAGFLPISYRFPADLALIVHWILDLVAEFLKSMRSRMVGKSKVKDSKYAKASIRRLIEKNKGVFDRLARGEREE